MDKERWKNIIFSIDSSAFIVALLIGILFINDYISIRICIYLFEKGLTIFSILFSAALAIMVFIIASSDSKFAKFMESKSSSFSKLLLNLKITIGSLFISLLISMVFLIILKYKEELDIIYVTKFYLIIYLMFVSYSIVALIQAIFDVFNFARYRVMFSNNEKLNVVNK